MPMKNRSKNKLEICNGIKRVKNERRLDNECISLKKINKK